jgi:phosphoenolpyruvate-protein phosphotransferase (PTS system enzyme I)
VSVCGEMAANPRLIPLLLGLGLRSFSMNAAAVPRVKQAIRSVEIDTCARFARRVMEQSDPLKIAELVAGFNRLPSGTEAHGGGPLREGVGGSHRHKE